MNNKWQLPIAVLFGAAAFFVINRSNNQKIARDQAGTRYAQVLYTRVPIQAGTELKGDLLTVKPVPEQYVSPQAILQQDLKMVLGRSVQANLNQETMLSLADIQGETASSFTQIIPSGEGAYSVSISRGIKPGLIRSGDHIDLMATFTLPKAGEDSSGASASWRQGQDMVNVVLLQNVTVLAVGDSFSNNARSEGGGGADLTLSLTLQEAQTLMFASQHGELGAVLRPEKAGTVRQRQELKRITYHEIEQIIGDLDDSRKKRTIEVQRGTGTTAYPVNGAGTETSTPRSSK